MTAIEEIKELADKYQNQLNIIRTTGGFIKRDIKVAMRRHEKELKEQVGEAKECKEQLLALIKKNPQLFKKPKSIKLSFIKLGWKKLKGKIVVKNEETTIKKIEQQYEDPYGHLIKIDKKVILKGVEKLPAEELKKLGITIEDSTDAPFITEEKFESDKLVELLMEVK